MQARTRLRDLLLLTITLISSLFHLVGVLTRGPSFLYAGYTRLAVIYFLLAFGAAAAVFLLLQGKSLVRLLAGIALLVTLGSVAYIGSLWSYDMRRAMADVSLAPIEAAKVGIVISPMDQSREATASLRTLESAIVENLRQYGLEPFVVVRRAYPVTSEEQARRLGERLRANVVVWATQPERTGTPQQHVTVLGANETPIALEPVPLMLLLTSEGTLTIPEGGLSKEGIASVAGGFASFALGHPVIAAAQFQSALSASGVPTATLAALHSYRGTALLLAERPDLALQEFERANEIAPDATAWSGIGITHLARRDWDATREAFSRALALNPYSPVPYCGMGILASRERNVGRAISSYQQAIALQSNRGAPYALLGLAYELEANVPAAQEAYKKAAYYAGSDAGLRIAAEERAQTIERNPPTAVPTATPPPVPTQTPVPTADIYSVKRGDTLKSIADQYGVTMEEIIELNNLSDPDAIYIGQRLIIPQKPAQ